MGKNIPADIMETRVNEKALKRFLQEPAQQAG